MTNSNGPGLGSRLANTFFALVLGGLVLSLYWPILGLANLHRADLQLRGVWTAGHALRVLSVVPDGVASSAGLAANDLLQFDPRRPADWVLAGYRPMPAGFSASIEVRHPDGTRRLVSIAPLRVSYLPSPLDHLSLAAFLTGSTMMLLLGVFLVWARPGLMTWSLLLASCSWFPYIPWGTHYLAFEAGNAFDARPFVTSLLVGAVAMLIPFAARFPYDAPRTQSSWLRVMSLGGVVLVWVGLAQGFRFTPFLQDVAYRSTLEIVANTALYLLCLLVTIGMLLATYRRSEPQERARLRWALLGVSACLAGAFLAIALTLLPYVATGRTSGPDLTPSNWALAACTGVFLPLAIGVAVLRRRVIDIQFAISRTVVYGVVSTLVLTVLATVHWLLGRFIEQSHLAIGLEAVAAIGLGLVLHRTTHLVNRLVDRVLFREHHEAEERLRRVTEALPYATDERTIADALVNSPVSNLALASAALFYRESSTLPLRRAMSVGWRPSDTEILDANCLLVRYLQAEHAPLRLNDPLLLPSAVPPGPATPVLAVPVVNQHVLIAIALYGSHTNGTLPDPDEVILLKSLAKAAAASHQQVRIRVLRRQNAAQKEVNERLEAALAELRKLVSEMNRSGH